MAEKKKPATKPVTKAQADKVKGGMLGPPTAK